MARKTKVLPLINVLVDAIPDFDNWVLFKKKMDFFTDNLVKFRICGISDRKSFNFYLNEKWASENWRDFKYFWTYPEKYGKENANSQRDKQAIKECDILIVFWDGKFQPIGRLINMAEKANLQIRTVEVI